MKKVIRLTESDLIRIVKRVINEQSADYLPRLKQLFNKYKSRWNRFSGSEPNDIEVRNAQEFLNSTGDIGPGKKYGKLKITSRMDQETFYQIQEYIRKKDPKFNMTINLSSRN